MIYFMIISTKINCNFLKTKWVNQEKYEKKKETKGKQKKKVRKNNNTIFL